MDSEDWQVLVIKDDRDQREIVLMTSKVSKEPWEKMDQSVPMVPPDKIVSRVFFM